MDCWGAFECTILVGTVLHLETGKIGPQENYTLDKFVSGPLAATLQVELSYRGKGPVPKMMEIFKILNASKHLATNCPK